MPFPDAGESIPSTEVGDIKFSDLRLSYINNEGGGADGDETLNNEEGVLNLSLFRNATFTSGDPVPGTGAISIGTDFCGKTFGSGEESFSVQIIRGGPHGDAISIEFEGVTIEDALDQGGSITHSHTAGENTTVTVLFNHGSEEFIVDEENLSNCKLSSGPTSELDEEADPPITTTVSIVLLDPNNAVFIPLLLY
jgi:hypothetical protein